MVQRWKFPEVASVICGGLISHQDHGKAVCFARGYCLCSTDKLSGRLQGTARGGHCVPVGPRRIPGEHVLVMCFACPNGRQHRSAGQLECTGPFPQWFVEAKECQQGFLQLQDPLDLQASGSHCPPVPETLMVQDSYLAPAETYCVVIH